MSRPSLRWLSLPVFAALVTGAMPAWGQVQFAFAGRRGGPRGDAVTRTDRLGARDCASAERWSFRATLDAPAAASPTVWVASSGECDPEDREPAAASPRCFQLCGPDLRDHCAEPLLAGASQYTVSVPAARLVDAVNAQCPTIEETRRVFLVVDGTVVARSLLVTVDTLSPAPVSSPSATAEEGTARVAWDYSLPDAGGTTATDAAVDDAGPVDAGAATPGVPRVETLGAVYVLCDPPRGMEGGDAGPRPDGAVACGTGIFADLDPNNDAQLAAWRCNDPDAGVGSPNAITGLRNGVSYRFAVVAEDRAGNRSTPALTQSCATPSSATDYWERYRQEGGQAQPGFCAVRPGPVGAGGLALGALGLVAVAALRRRRRPR